MSHRGLAGGLRPFTKDPAARVQAEATTFLYLFTRLERMFWGGSLSRSCQRSWSIIHWLIFPSVPPICQTLPSTSSSNAPTAAQAESQAADTYAAGGVFVPSASNAWTSAA